MKLLVVAHKETGDLALMTQWWEVAESDEIINLDKKEASMAGLGPNRLKIGALVQVGWLLQNRNEVWFGLGIKAIDSFEVLGDL